MLKFTEAQARAVMANRKAFNVSQRALQARVEAALVGNADPLPKYFWEQIDRDSVEIQRDVLSVFNDLAATNSMSVPVGIVHHLYQTVSDSSETNISLDGRSRALTDAPVYDYHGTPLPIIDSTFSFGWRQVEAARANGFSLDPAARDNATRKVAEKLEDLALNGDPSIVVGGDPIYGLTTFPSRNTRTTSAALTTGAIWLTNVVATLNLLYADNFYTPATLYVNWSDWFLASTTDYSTSYPKTILSRLMEIPGIAAIVPASKVTAGDIIAVAKRRDVVQVLNGMPISTRAQFRANPEDDYNFVVMAAAAVQLRRDAGGQCGIAHSSL